MPRKESKRRKQASAVPFRMTAGGIEFCLITSRRSGKWGFPKGMIERGETLAEAALKEASEEAGLQGRILSEPLGRYKYSKWKTKLLVTAVLMEVTQTATEWDEMELRDRRWVTPQEARLLLCRETLQQLFDSACARLTPAIELPA